MRASSKTSSSCQPQFGLYYSYSVLVADSPCLSAFLHLCLCLCFWCQARKVITNAFVVVLDSTKIRDRCRSQFATVRWPFFSFSFSYSAYWKRSHIVVTLTMQCILCRQSAIVNLRNEALTHDSLEALTLHGVLASGMPHRDVSSPARLL